MSLRDRGVTGRIPDEVGLPSFLEMLDVSGIALEERVPDDLRWTSLTSLGVSGNRLRDVIPRYCAAWKGSTATVRDEQHARPSCGGRGVTAVAFTSREDAHCIAAARTE